MPQITFIKINNSLALPVKIFLNRKKIQSSNLSSTVTINQKSIVKLKRINYLKLSIKDLNKLVEDIKDDFINIILKTSLEDLVENSKKGRRTVELNLGSWKCSLIITLELIIELRRQLNLLTLKDLHMIEERKLKIPLSSKQDLRLLVKKLHFTFSKEEEEKKSTEYSILQMTLTNKLSNCALLYVNIVPLT